MTTSEVKDLREILPSLKLSSEWNVKVIRSEQCLSYIAWNSRTLEAIVVDPKLEDLPAYLKIAAELPSYLWLGIFDTHTHADHVSIAPKLATKIQAPLFMFMGSSNTRVDLRIARDTQLISRAAALNVLHTPGHTPDSMTVTWGPFVFTGDTVLIGDTGRDDLPGGSPEDHFESLEKLKSRLDAGSILLPGHDRQGPRASIWKQELQNNMSLSQSREDFVRESNAYSAPAPQLLKESLRENLR